MQEKYAKLLRQPRDEGYYIVHTFSPFAQPQVAASSLAQQPPAGASGTTASLVALSQPSVAVSGQREINRDFGSSSSLRNFLDNSDMPALEKVNILTMSLQVANAVLVDMENAARDRRRPWAVSPTQVAQARADVRRTVKALEKAREMETKEQEAEQIAYAIAREAAARARMKEVRAANRAAEAETQLGRIEYLLHSVVAHASRNSL